MTLRQSPIDSFVSLGLPGPIVRALDENGYEAPCRLQQACIPPLLAGRDVLVQTHTGTGRTLAFVLPTLARLDLSQRRVQALVLTPNDETSLHVAEVYQEYARHLPDFHAMPLYHQSSAIQLRQLQRGCQVIVGTPPRVAHYLDFHGVALDGLRTLVLDQADMMLEEGLGTDVRTVLARACGARQRAIFTAALTRELQLFAEETLSAPLEVDLREPSLSLPCVRQRYWQVDGRAKLNALARVFEVEPDFDAALVFVHHKNTAAVLTEKLKARGYAAERLDGDTLAYQRAQIAARFADRQIDILVATDHSLDGLDVSRVTHVVSFDIPCDVKSHEHRVRHLYLGGDNRSVILLVTQREMGMLHSIEQATGQAIKALELPERVR